MNAIYAAAVAEGRCCKEGCRMINSTTGYGRAQDIQNGRDILVEIRAVNHRYFEQSVRVPRAFSYLEEKIKAYVQSKVARGKLEVSLTVQDIAGADTQIELNMALAKGYAEALDRMAKELGYRVIVKMEGEEIPLQKFSQEDRDVFWMEMNDRALRRVGYVPKFKTDIPMLTLASIRRGNEHDC